MYVPQKVFFVKEGGVPPKCKRLPISEGIRLLASGALTFEVMARNATNEPNRVLKTFNTTQSAQGDKDGKWTSVVAMAILLP
jgi:pyruvoyl-dependent arginine decarboxylase (PvlArgDC)